MIHDRLENFGLYVGVHPLFGHVAAALASGRLTALGVGEHDLGRGVRVGVSEYLTRPPGEGVLECHRRCVDIQIVASGRERIGVRHRDGCAAADYDEARDFQALVGEHDLLTLEPGSFMIFLPDDAHMPQLAVGAPAPVRKLVVKVPV
ncbi:MAG: YhcH/YjgK/YiaL family protein [Candidatus Krumholzibacteriia bacterium]